MTAGAMDMGRIHHDESPAAYERPCDVFRVADLNGAWLLGYCCPDGDEEQARAEVVMEYGEDDQAAVDAFDRGAAQRKTEHDL